VPKVSIILPVYNREKYLEGAIQSVLAQTYKNWELLISDNCSQDRSAAIAEKYAQQDERIIFWQNGQNIGLFQNYNKCIEQSTGDYIELFGADDILEEKCLERLVEILEANPQVALVTAARKLIDQEGQCIGIVNPHTGDKEFNLEQIMENTISNLNNWIVAPVMFRSKYKGTGFNLHLKLSADLEYWLNILAGGNLLYIDEALFQYRVHPGSETSKIFKDFSYVLDVLRLADKFAKHVIKGNAVSEQFRNLVMERLSNLTNYAVRQLNINYDSVLLPYSGEHPQESNSNCNADLNLEEYSREIHDYKRIACMSLLQSIDPGQEHQRLKDEREQLLQQLAQSQRDNIALRNYIEEQGKEISSLLNSQSWKITAPLRRIKKDISFGN
jgi:glycosyltransferase involved in cell wall biosynthesis